MMSAHPAPDLVDFCMRSLERPVQPEVRELAGQIAALHAGVEAVLAYGSCLRGEALEGTLIDYYVLTRDLSGVSTSLVSQAGCAILPPNVYYHEGRAGSLVLRAKYAVLPLSAFERWVSAGTSNPYFWARFCQPSALVQVSGEEARRKLASAVATAVRTFLAHARSLPQHGEGLELWQQGFRATYGTELRSEGQDRAAHIVASYPDYYREAATLAGDVAASPVNWRARRMAGKLLSVLRLAKASFTFRGGADYLAWKIERHSGVKVELTEWQRRHPLLAGPLLLFQLRRKGAVR